MSVRPSLNIQALMDDDQSENEESWMISYIDVFVLMTSIFVVLFMMNRVEQQVQPLADQNTVSDATQTMKQVGSLTNSLPAEGELEVLSEAVHALSDPKWVSDIKSSIEERRIGEHVQLTSNAEFTALEIQSRVLFNSGASTLARSGEALLENLLPVLKASEGLVFIEGHTDDDPILTKEFPSNWDLASARATEVLQYFVLEGIEKSRFRAVSYGDTKPLVPNDTEANRRKNRRVSLLIQRPH